MSTVWNPVQGDISDPTDSADLTTIRVQIADLLQQALAYRGLTHVYAHPPKQAPVVPCGLVYLADSALTLLTESSPNAQLEADQEYDLALEVALITSPLNGDMMQMAADAEGWVLPVLRVLNKNFTVDQAVFWLRCTGVRLAPIKLGETATPPEWYGPIFRVQTLLEYNMPRQV